MTKRPLTKDEARYSELFVKKFGGGLTPDEAAELDALNVALDDAAEDWYRPIFEMLKKMRQRVIEGEAE